MKVKGKDPREVCEGLLKRSKCSVQVAAVLSDKTGIHAWGWNSEGPNGFGLHAEQHCLQRSNFKRVSKSVLWVASRRKKSGNSVNSRPCGVCWPAVSRCVYVVYRNKDNSWTSTKGS